MRKTALIVSLILLGGCATDGPAPDPCGPWRPLYVDKDDSLTISTARALLAHNETGRELCGWGQ
jgi:hypothetical protein